MIPFVKGHGLGNDYLVMQEADLPGPLAAIAEWNPVSSLANALRTLFGNSAPPGFPAQTGWAAAHPVAYSLLCTLLLVTTFAVLSTWRYRNRTQG